MTEVKHSAPVGGRSVQNKHIWKLSNFVSHVGERSLIHKTFYKLKINWGIPKNPEPSRLTTVPSGEGLSTKKRSVGGFAIHRWALLWYNTSPYQVIPLSESHSEPRDPDQPSSPPVIYPLVHLFPAEGHFPQPAEMMKRDLRFPLNSLPESLNPQLDFLPEKLL